MTAAWLTTLRNHGKGEYVLINESGEEERWAVLVPEDVWQPLLDVAEAAQRVSNTPGQRYGFLPLLKALDALERAVSDTTQADKA